MNDKDKLEEAIESLKKIKETTIRDTVYKRVMSFLNQMKLNYKLVFNGLGIKLNDYDVSILYFYDLNPDHFIIEYQSICIDVSLYWYNDLFDYNYFKGCLEKMIKIHDLFERK